jgi:ketosteroid isomerase-like protein
MPEATKRIPDETQINNLLDAYAAAIRDRDARATVAFYARDVVAYDLAPPLHMKAETVRDPAHIQQWFDTWDGPIETEAHDLKIVVGGDVAYAYGLRHMTGTKTDGEHPDLWFRATACFRRERGGWKITHVHNSVPFAMDGSDRALLDLKP